MGVHGGRGDPVLRAVRAGPGFVRLRPEHVPRLSVLRGRLLRGLLEPGGQGLPRLRPVPPHGRHHPTTHRRRGETSRPRRLASIATPTCGPIPRRFPPPTRGPPPGARRESGPATSRRGATPRPPPGTVEHDPGSRGGRPHGLLGLRRCAARGAGAGRVGLAASVAWVVVGALAVVVLGASPAPQVPVPRGSAAGRVRRSRRAGRRRPLAGRSTATSAGDARSACHAAAAPGGPRGGPSRGPRRGQRRSRRACRGRRRRRAAHAGADGDGRIDPRDRRALVGPPQGSTWRSAKSTLAGRSASRRMYHGYQCLP